MKRKTINPTLMAKLIGLFCHFFTPMDVENESGVDYFFFLLSLFPAKPARPVPKRSMDAGSGVGEST